MGKLYYTLEKSKPLPFNLHKKKMSMMYTFLKEINKTEVYLNNFNKIDDLVIESASYREFMIDEIILWCREMFVENLPVSDEIYTFLVHRVSMLYDSRVEYLEKRERG